VFAASNVLDLFANELTGGGGGTLALRQVAFGFLEGSLFRHILLLPSLNR
jgi:hypothetical protein